MDQNNLEQSSTTERVDNIVNPPEECLIPLEVVKHLLLSGDLATSNENKKPLKLSEELLRHVAAACHIMAHDMLEKAAKSALNLDKTTVHYDDVDQSWTLTMINF